MKRRKFIKQIGLGTVIAGFNAFPVDAFAKAEMHKLTILHTNDWHSRLDPFPMDGGRYQGLGGIAKRAAYINKVRKIEKELLLLDSGDIFQGTPYFNYFGGEPELKLMTELKYDAATMGNHDFDVGIEGFDKVLPLADFPFLTANYDFSDTILNKKTKPWTTFQKGDIKVGVFGLGIELNGLVAENLYGDTQYLDPISIANKTALHLKQEEKCQLVICLSHLGYKYNSDTVSDVALAKMTNNIDVILGGHTHTFLEKAEVHKNNIGKEVIINQVGWAGILVGRLDIVFEKNFKNKCISCSNSLLE